MWSYFLNYKRSLQLFPFPSFAFFFGSEMIHFDKSINANSPSDDIYLFTIIHNLRYGHNIADPSSMQDVCPIWTQLNGLASPLVLVAQWIERCLVFKRSRVWFPSGTQNFFFVPCSGRVGHFIFSQETLIVFSLAWDFFKTMSWSLKLSWEGPK